MVGFFFSGWRFEVDECANSLGNGLVGSFNDSVGCWGVWRDVDNINVGIHERELEIVTDKFGAIVMDNLERAWIASEPIVFKQSFCV